MKDKEKQDYTKVQTRLLAKHLIESENRQKSSEKKQIEEMAKIIHHTEFVDISGYEEEKIAEELLKYYQPKLPEDSVVLSKENYDKLCHLAYFGYDDAYEKGSKETAEKFLQLAYDRCLEKSFIKKVEELAKQFSVEIKEDD